MRFENSTVFITGATGGIGRTIVKRFYEEGANIGFISQKLEKAQTLADELGMDPVRYYIAEANNTKEQEIAEAIAKTVEQFGRLDVLVNNAGITGEAAKLAEYPSDEMKRVLEVNIMGTFYGMKHAIRAMEKNGKGVIVNMDSIQGIRALPLTSGYTASKHAIMGLTKAAAIEYARSGIRICAVCPSPVDTPLIKGVEEGMLAMGEKTIEEIRRELVAPIPMGRYVTTDEVASAVLFLASDEASFINGSAILVDGCFSA